MTFAAFLYAYAGLALLGLAMNRHYQQVWGRIPVAPISLALRLCGWSLLAGSLLTCILKISWSIGFASWVGALSAAAAVLIFLLPYRPKAAAALAVITPALATALILLA
jgi:hypothetical protein